MTWQLYWRNWWQAWPYYKRHVSFSYSRLVCFDHVFCLGPFQARWYSSVIL